MNKKYKIKVVEQDNKYYNITVECEDIEWFMNQYQKHSPPFSWSIVE